MHTLIRFTLGLAALAFGAILPAAADSITETRAAAGFTAVSLSAPIRVDLTLGEPEGLVLEGEAAALSRIETSIENGVLRIRMKAHTMSWNPKVRARVTARRIDALSIAGSGDIHARQLSGDALKVSIAGSGDVVVGGGKVDGLTLSIAGSGEITRLGAAPS